MLEFLPDLQLDQRVLHCLLPDYHLKAYRVHFGLRKLSWRVFVHNARFPHIWQNNVMLKITTEEYCRCRAKNSYKCHQPTIISASCGVVCDGWHVHVCTWMIDPRVGCSQTSKEGSNFPNRPGEFARKQANTQCASHSAILVVKCLTFFFNVPASVELKSTGMKRENQNTRYNYFWYG